jgi:hypothetical protein
VINWLGGPVYTAHARRQMGDPRRRVTEAQVERVLAGYDMSRLDQDGNLRLSGDVGGWRVLIVVAAGSNPPRIISVWPTGRRRRV